MFRKIKLENFHLSIALLLKLLNNLGHIQISCRVSWCMLFDLRYHYSFFLKYRIMFWSLFLSLNDNQRVFRTVDTYDNFVS